MAFDPSSWNDRFGCAAKIVGEPLPTSDNRRPQSNPHLRVSLGYLEAVFDYLRRTKIRVYRLPSNLCPYATHPQYPQFAWQQQFAECQEEFVRLRDILKVQDLRLSFHPSQYILLNSPNETLTQTSLGELEWQCRLLDELEMDDSCKVFLHVGGVYGDRPAARERMLVQLDKLPEVIRRRFALENDDVSWGASDVLDICSTSGIPMIFDFHHHACLNQGEPWREMLDGALGTWPEGQRPKTHLSTPKTDASPPDKITKELDRWKAPPIRSHADYIDPFVMTRIIEGSEDRVYDVMLEAKAKDLAVLKLRKDLARGYSTAAMP